MIFLKPPKPVSLKMFLSFFIHLYDESYLYNVVARGENTRRRHASLGKSCLAVVPEIRDEQLREIICLQSGRNYVVD